MGLITTVIVINDALEEIRNNPGEFCAGLVKAISLAGTYPHPGPIRAGHHATAARVIETHHVDTVVAVAVGANDGEILFSTPFDTSHVDALKLWADKLGYSVVEKTQPKPRK